MDGLLLLLLLGLALWFWQSSLRARERAREAGFKACQRCRVQLLDDTVALHKLWIRRNTHGRLCFERLYIFEFSDTGDSRRRGSVTLLGGQVEVLHMEPGDLLIP